MTSDDFSLDAVHRLVDVALGESAPGETSRLDEPLQRSSEVQSPHRRVTLGHSDAQIVRILPRLLEDVGLEGPDIQMVLQEVRGALTQDLDLGSLREIHSLSLHCRRCPERRIPTTPLGNLADPDLVFVSDTPLSTWPDVLQRSLESAELSLSRCALTYLTRCKEPFRGSTSDEQERCSSYLFSEIQILQPKLLVLLGASVSSFFLGPSQIRDVHGSLFWCGPWALLPAYSIGYLSHKENAQDDFRADIATAVRFVRGAS